MDQDDEPGRGNEAQAALFRSASSMRFGVSVGMLRSFLARDWPPDNYLEADRQVALFHFTSLGFCVCAVCFIAYIIVVIGIIAVLCVVIFTFV